MDLALLVQIFAQTFHPYPNQCSDSITIYYGLNMKCPLEAHVLEACLSAYGLLGSDWILRS
jgi:hypothetical protein